MTARASQPAGSLPAAELAELVRWGRLAVFAAALLLSWITLEPFADLTSTDVLELATGRDGATYLAYGLLAAAGLAIALMTQPKLLATLFHPMWILLALWLGVTVVTSADPGLSLRRLVLFGMLALICATLFLMPRGRSQMAMLLVATAGIVTALSLVGVTLFPELAIHQATDVGEPQLAGDWRGVFAHKNTTGAIFAMFIFMMIFAIRAGHGLAAAPVLAASVLIVVMSGAKSSTILFVGAMIVSFLVARIRSGVLVGVVALAPLAVLSILGPGSVVSDAIGGVVRMLPVDVTFTGRADIWELALEKIAERPITGWGYQAYWALESTRFGQEDTTQWAGHAAHAHNGYIDAALNMGLPGLALTLVVFVILPLRNYLAARRGGADPALLLLMLQIWLFGVYLSVMESFMYLRFHPTWITFLIAVFGLHYLARRPHVAP
jgi:O-antigen ligase